MVASHFFVMLIRQENWACTLQTPKENKNPSVDSIEHSQGNGTANEPNTVENWTEGEREREREGKHQCSHMS